MEKSEYRERVKLAVEHLHNCRAQWAGTAPVHEVFKGQTIWQGNVEIYDLTGHPKAKRCYAWAHREGPNDEGERFVTNLELPPVDSPQSAVRFSIVADAKKKR